MSKFKIEINKAYKFVSDLTSRFSNCCFIALITFYSLIIGITIQQLFELNWIQVTIVSFLPVGLILLFFITTFAKTKYESFVDFILYTPFLPIYFINKILK